MLTYRLKASILKDYGYSLIELLVALGVVAAVLLAAIPSFQGVYKKNALQLRVMEVKQIIRYARFKALTEGKELRLIPLNQNNWSQGIKLIETYSKDKNNIISLHEWSWNSTSITLQWHGFQSEHFVSFSPSIDGHVANGYFELSDGIQTRRLTLNRIARAKVEDQ
ncbi:GspH/FimT family pseudopilin [Legionella yabuuchiae]|uniref:GspH/FimT family pseudopilin n=1 Tax=Legionella yabuuchiae TaxID=376727 RepID=UPI00105560C7|nr:GspH/FimT family pseudopilin [Legionella yabuuchiae]